MRLTSLILTLITYGQIAGQDAPDAAFEKLKQIKREAKWEQIQTVMTPDGMRKTFDDYIISALLSWDRARQPEFSKQLAELFEKHGIKSLLIEGAEKQTPRSKDEADASCKKVTKAIGMKKLEFFKELDAVLKNHPENTIHACAFFDGTLSKVKITGNVALGEIRYTPTSIPRMVRFKRINEHWKFDGIQNLIIKDKRK